MTRYFYAGGERHALEPADGPLAIDTRAVAAAGLGDIVAVLPIRSKLPGGVVLVDRADCTDEIFARLNRAGVIRSVYRSGRAFVVPMPEVRVEFEGDQRADAIRALGKSPVPADITEDTPDRLALRPRSGKGDDALDLANYIYEHAHPAASTVRMLQVVPKVIPRR
jgi:hypothetical protein